MSKGEGTASRHSPTLEKVKRQCCQLMRLLGRVPVLGPEQLRRGMGLAIAGVMGYHARSTPVPFAVCTEIEAVRAEALQRRGICPSEPRILIFAPPEAGGCGHEHSYPYASAALLDTF